ncbi:MAG: methionine biosynthesis protein MetW [Tissierellia bacterium]|nr:methionine biosynthesis protein MetW [Tissierellia bacterium]
MHNYSEMILHVVFNLENQKQKISVDLLRQKLIWEADKSVLLESKIRSLIEKGYLLKENNSLLLTNKGRIEATGISKAMVKDEFSKKIDRLTRSSAYLDFCEEVYGYRVYLFNMMDKQQLDFVLGSIPLSADDTILDLGCGSGSTLNLLVKKYGCRGIGIDQLDDDILDRPSMAITYINGDIDRISDYSLKPTVTLSIDSLYFSKDLDKLVQQLNSIENNKMYLFYSQYIFDEVFGDKSILHSNNTKIADVLNKNNISFRTIDYGENERLLYENSLIVLKKYKKAFEDEENLDLYEQKLKEVMMGLELYDNNLASRYLYIIDGM